MYFLHSGFWATCACPENRVPWNFRIQDFWATCACPENRVPWNFSLYWIFFLHSGCLSNLRLPWKQSALKFSLSGFLSNLSLPWKTEYSLKFFTVLNILFTFRIFEQHALALKTECALKFFTVLNILFAFRIFEQLLLALKTECALNFSSLGGRPPPTNPGLVRLWLSDWSAL